MNPLVIGALIVAAIVYLITDDKTNTSSDLFDKFSEDQDKVDR
jgi:hypothetical protein